MGPVCYCTLSSMFIANSIHFVNEMVPSSNIILLYKLVLDVSVTTTVIVHDVW
jgi:hypothetical protein